MQVIILAAGRGERLRPLTDDRPKCLIEIHGGVPLIDMQLRSISAVPGIERVVLVTGYRAQQIEEHLNGRSILPVETLYNPFYDISNDLVSLWTARSYMSEPFIVLNGDDVFVPKVMADLMKASGDVCAVIDRKESYDLDDMKVLTEGQRLVALSKEIPLDEATGESIGMIRFQGEGAPQMRKALEDLVRTEGHRKLHWLAAVQWVIDNGVEVCCSECRPEDWAEVDFHIDLEHVRGRVQAARQLAQLLDTTGSQEPG